MISRLILTTIILSMIGGVVYAASVTTISGDANVHISFNKPKEASVGPMVSGNLPRLPSIR